MRLALGALVTFVLMAAMATAPAMAYTSLHPTSVDNPLAGRSWFVDWQKGMSQQQFLEYLTGGDLDRLDEIVYGSQVLGVHGPARLSLRFQARWTVAKDPYAWLPRVPLRNREKARLVLKLARNPQTLRVGGWTKNPRLNIRRALDLMRRTTPGGVAFLFVYRFPHRRCGRYDAGGPRDWAAYRRWINSLVRGISNDRVAVFLEPDGLGTITCLTRRARRARYRLFRYAIRRLSVNSNTTIYLDAGHSGWLKPRAKARMLRRAGVMSPQVRGFFLNSTGYNRTLREVRLGNRIGRLLGGKHYVVSTAINGNGAYRVRRKRFPREQRCNPPGRALGPEPTVITASRLADAYVWIGDPGRSGGGSRGCHHAGQPTPPPPTQWWEWYALDLARSAHWE